MNHFRETQLFESLSDAGKNLLRRRIRLLDIPPFQKMLEWWNWQTRTFEGRVAQAVRVQIPPRAPNWIFRGGQEWSGFVSS